MRRRGLNGLRRFWDCFVSGNPPIISYHLLDHGGDCAIWERMRVFPPIFVLEKQWQHSPLVGSIKGPANGSDLDRFMESPLQYPSTKSFLRTLVDEPISQCQCSYLLLVAPPGIFKPGRVPLLLRNLREQDVVELRGVPRQVRGAPPVPRAGSCWVIWWDFLGKSLFINWNFAAAQWWWRISQSSGAKTCTLRNANRPFT